MSRVLAVVFAAVLAIGDCGVMPGAAPNLYATEWSGEIVLRPGRAGR